jgi:hypothetical protein
VIKPLPSKNKALIQTSVPPKKNIQMMGQAWWHKPITPAPFWKGNTMQAPHVVHQFQQSLSRDFLFLYWGYLVTFTKVLTIYHS